MNEAENFTLEEIHDRCNNLSRDEGAYPEECLCNFPPGFLATAKRELDIPFVCWNPYCKKGALMTSWQREFNEKCSMLNCVMNIQTVDLTGDVTLHIDNECHKLDNRDRAELHHNRKVPSKSWKLQPVIVPIIFLLCVSLLRI